MQRIACFERDDWQATADATGFVFHTDAGERYWDERAYYAFTLNEIEQQIEAPTAELNAMCRELVGRAVKDERYLRLLKIPQAYWTLIAASWQRNDPSLYGRFDFRFDGKGPAKLLEYNADTPTSLFEAAVFQWTWLEQAIERQIIPKRADQYNSLHEQLIEAWRKIGNGKRLHLAAAMDNAEDRGTVQYLADVAQQGGLDTVLIDIAEIGWQEAGHFVDLQDQPIELAFKLYPWEWMMREEFGARLKGASTRWIEPPWESDPVQQGHLAAAVGDVSEPSQPAAGLFRRRYRGSRTRHVLCAETAVFARRCQCHAGARRRRDRCAARALWRRGFHPPDAGAAAGIRRPVSGTGEAGWSTTCPAGSPSARTRTRSPATCHGSCRTRSCSDA